MAPSSGHLLVPKILRIVKFSYTQTKALLKSKLPQSLQSTTSNPSLQPIRVYAQNHPIHPLAYLKQSRQSQNHSNRWFATSAPRPFTSPSGSSPPYDRSKFPTSRTSKAIFRSGSAPFASTLRPNLTGGALPRSAGGYGLSGAGARHFSHTSGAQAQVVHNVSAGIRAFCIGGGKARFDGVDPVTGEKRFKAISQTEDVVHNGWQKALASKAMRGTNLDFKLSPTITALSPIFSSSKEQASALGLTSLNTPSLLDTLATDFARALRDLSLILADLRQLSTFGDLPITLIPSETGPTLRVRFPGCDADLVSKLCDEVNVRRGVITEDEAWTEEKDVEMALLFPFAPAGVVDAESDYGDYFHHAKNLEDAHQPDELDWRHMLSPVKTPSTFSYSTLHAPHTNTQSPSGYESLAASDFGIYDHDFHSSPKAPSRSMAQSQDYEGLEGIYKFLQVCDESKRAR